ncbi:MAG TPA: hypothetical protein VLB44_24085, partial [Kofleriaceae bacterium]|nr:hypothetical protein [Kofleriaceae bacterium]
AGGPRVKRLAWLVLLLGGCDKLFSIDHVDLDKDAQTADTNGDAPTPVDAPEACPQNYRIVQNTPLSSVYRLGSTPMSWDAAAADCNNDTLTRVTHLIVFDDIAELVAIRPFVNAAAPWSAYVGYARDTIAQGGDPTMFTSVTGTPLSATSMLWGTNEPDNGGGPGLPEETVVFIRDDKDLTDGPDTYPFVYICECDHVPANQVFHTVN